ncbi:VWA domain-containing protein [Planococcus sp. CPCC 101016]|nr:VWA domain-containing protein [Planococcus sp. CPCC 101016]
MDNANLFRVPDIDQVSGKELYNQMLNEFPEWL